jgi:nucleoside-diphosphate-sugar epimerase
MKRIILTGASGFVGANLARRLLRDGHELHLLLRRNHHPWRIAAIQDDAQLHETDLSDEESLARIVESVRPEWVFHLAAYGAYAPQTDLRRMVWTNILGTMNLVQACLKTGFEAFVNTGSSSEYGFKDHAPAEDESLEPNSPYAVTKASATLFCRHTARSRQVHLPTLRLYSIYGPYEEPSRLIPTLIVRGLNGQLPPLVNPETARDFVYIDDVVEAYLLAATQSFEEHGAVYNVGSGIQTTMREVVEVARRVMNIEDEPEWGSMPARQWDTQVWVSDNSKIRNALGWQPRFTLEQGLRATVDWLKENPALLNFYRSSGRDSSE